MKSFPVAWALIPGFLVAAALCLAGPAHAVGGNPAGGDVRTEILLGKGVAERILKLHGAFEHPVLSPYIERVGQALAAHAGRPEIQFHFGILDTDEEGAYATPGGYVFLTRGALTRLQDEAELAGLLAHEIGHVTRFHLINEIRPLLDNRGGIGTVHSAVSSARLNRVATARASDRGAEILLTSGLSSEDEFEADRVGTRLLALAGYQETALRNHIRRLRHEQASAAKTMLRLLDQRLSVLDTVLSESDAAVRRRALAQGDGPMYVPHNF